MYNERNTDINITIVEFNLMHLQLHFTIEKENNNTINFSDLKLFRKKMKSNIMQHF
jgi:hypothetical protein